MMSLKQRSGDCWLQDQRPCTVITTHTHTCTPKGKMPGLELAPSPVEFKVIYLAAMRGLSWEGLIYDAGCRSCLY